MGGRGSSGGGREGGGGGVSPGNIISVRDIGSDIAEGGKIAEARDVLSVSDDMLRQYGDSVQLFSFQEAQLGGKDAYSTIAYYDGANIAINQNYYDAAKLEKAYAACVKTGYHPIQGDKTAMQAVAAHEYGHALTDFAAQKMGISGLNALKTAADRICNEARKLTGHRGVVQMERKISGYATASNAEAVAEAVSDVYCNGRRAAAESHAIVNTLNKYLRGR